MGGGGTPKGETAFYLGKRRVQADYINQHVFYPNLGKYEVMLPRKTEQMMLGESRNRALQRFYTNERSLQRKGTWAQFQKVVQEYLDLDHARLCTKEELALPASEVYYLPMHSVSKVSSSTTKLRVVFDASAPTTSGVSLNDTLAVGPMLHPTLDQILLRFRCYRVALTGDIQKMYREILLAPTDQQYHRFLWRAQLDQPVKEHCMNRVTFGVASSPYLAVQTLQQTAADFGQGSPGTVYHIHHSFYVDDLLGGADTVKGAVALQREITHVLTQGGFSLRKFRSNSAKVLKAIPAELVEPMPTKELVDCHSGAYPKALGVKWDSVKDTMSVEIHSQGKFAPTKRGILSDISKTFDVLGWITPVILPMKILLQQLWDPKVQWDDPLEEHLRLKHQKWRDELPVLDEIELARCYYLSEKAVTVQLHGFSDASEQAFAAVVYLRATYKNSPPTVKLVVAKSRVAPMRQQRSVPELELCGAVLLAELLQSTQKTLDLAVCQVHAWSDSTIVLCWLGSLPTKYKTYVANRITRATEHFPSSMWHHVPTGDNPADCASRGISAGELRDHELWWGGPHWLREEPVDMPRQPQKAELESKQSTGMKAACMAITEIPPVWLAHRYRSCNKLIRVTAWIHRAAYNFSSKVQGRPANTAQLTVDEVTAAELFLIKKSQQRSFPQELKLLSHEPPKALPANSHLIPLHLFIGTDGLLHIGGRLSEANISVTQKHPILLSAKDEFTIRQFEQIHVNLCHCGPTLLFSSVGERFYCTGARLLARQVCHKCIVCRKIAAKAQTQLMGQLPPERVNPSRVFHTTGVDYCGPFPFKEERARGRVKKVKGYIAVFVCFVTKAIHLEPASDMTTETFLAAMKRFASRRNLPRHLYSDNGGNFIGAKKDLENLYQLIGTEELPRELQNFLVDHRMIWHTIPDRAPHFGGLWEAAVKSVKFHLKRVIGEQALTYEEMLTVTCQVEACLNSRPLGLQHCLSPDGIRPLTPGHFLTGAPMAAYPETEITPDISLSNRWTLCQSLVQQFWKKWSAEFLQQLQASHKWNSSSPSLTVGDIVLMKDASAFKMHWGLAKVTAVFPGKDGHVRAVEVLTKKVTVPDESVKRPISLSQHKVRTCTLRRPVTKLALLIPANKVTTYEGVLHSREDVQATSLCPSHSSQTSSCQTSGDQT